MNKSITGGQYAISLIDEALKSYYKQLSIYGKEILNHKTDSVLCSMYNFHCDEIRKIINIFCEIKSNTKNFCVQHGDYDDTYI